MCLWWKYCQASLGFGFRKLYFNIKQIVLHGPLIGHSGSCLSFAVHHQHASHVTPSTCCILMQIFLCVLQCTINVSHMSRGPHVTSYCRYLSVCCSAPSTCPTCYAVHMLYLTADISLCVSVHCQHAPHVKRSTCCISMQIYLFLLQCTINMPQQLLRLFRPPEDCDMCRGLRQVDRIANISPANFKKR